MINCYGPFIEIYLKGTTPTDFVDSCICSNSEVSFDPHSRMLGQTEVPSWTISYSALINIYGLFIKNVLSESDISRLKIAARKHKRSFTAGEKCRIVMFVLLNYQYQLGKVDIFRLGIL